MRGNPRSIRKFTSGLIRKLFSGDKLGPSKSGRPPRVRDPIGAARNPVFAIVLQHAPFALDDPDSNPAELDDPDDPEGVSAELDDSDDPDGTSAEPDDLDCNPAELDGRNDIELTGLLSARICRALVCQKVQPPVGTPSITRPSEWMLKSSG